MKKIEAKITANSTDFERKMRSAKSAANDVAKTLSIGLVAGAAAATAGIYGLSKVMGSSIALANTQEQAEAKLAAVLRATGGAAGYNLDQLKAMASGMQAASTTGDELILNGMGILATFKEVRGEAFEKGTQAALDMSAVMGQDLKSSMVQVGKALNDPIKGVSALTKVGVSFTEQQKDQIKALQESGDIMGAQTIILQELESEFGGAAAAMAETFGGKLQQVKNTFGDLHEEIGFTITKSDEFGGALDEVNVLLQNTISWVSENREEIAQLFLKGLDGARAFGTFLDGLVITMKDMGVLEDTVSEKRAARITQLQKEIIIHTEIAQNAKATGEVRLYHAELLAQKEAEYAQLMQKSRDEIAQTSEAEKSAGAVAVQTAEERIAANREAIVTIKTMWEEFEEGQKAISAVDQDLKEFFKDFDKDSRDGQEGGSALWQEFEAGQKAIAAVDNDLKLFFDDYDKDTLESIEATKRAAEEYQRAMEPYYSFAHGAIDSLTSAFISGENAKEAVARYTTNFLEETASGYLKKALPLVLDAVSIMLGAEVGLGTGKAAAEGEHWTEMLGNAALYLGGAGAAIMAGKAIGEASFATGGWIGAHPGGGLINQGSGVKDDVFLGATSRGRVHNYGMGGEFVINKKSTSKYYDEIEAINEDRFYAAGGWVPGDTSSEVADPYTMAERTNAGGFKTFMLAWGETKNVYSAIAAAIYYYAGALGGMFTGKGLGTEIFSGMFADGGPVLERRFGFGDFFDDFLDPFDLGDDLKKITDPLGIGDELGHWGNPWNWLDELPAWLDAGMISSTVDGTNQILVPFMRDIATPDKFPDPVQNIVDSVKHLFEEGIQSQFEKAADPFGIFGLNESANGGPLAMANGGIASTPILFGESGSEAFVPLHQGRDTLKVMHNDILSVKEALSKIKIEIYIEGNEIIKPQRLDGRIRVVSDSVVVERNRRSVGQLERAFT